jgi:hypothetical protein
MDWIVLPENSFKWWAFVNTVINFGFHRIREFLDLLRNDQLLKTNFPPWCCVVGSVSSIYWPCMYSVFMYMCIQSGIEKHRRTFRDDRGNQIKDFELRQEIVDRRTCPSFRLPGNAQPVARGAALCCSLRRWTHHWTLCLAKPTYNAEWIPPPFRGKLWKATGCHWHIPGWSRHEYCCERVSGSSSPGLQ